METISVRLSEALAARLTQEAQHAHQARSALVREALEEFLARRTRERLLASFAHEARELDRKELAALAEDFEAAEAEALQQAESLSASHTDPR